MEDVPQERRRVRSSERGHERCLPRDSDDLKCNRTRRTFGRPESARHQLKSFHRLGGIRIAIRLKGAWTRYQTRSFVESSAPLGRRDRKRVSSMLEIASRDIRASFRHLEQVHENSLLYQWIDSRTYSAGQMQKLLQRRNGVLTGTDIATESVPQRRRIAQQRRHDRTLTASCIIFMTRRPQDNEIIVLRHPGVELSS